MLDFLNGVDPFEWVKRRYGEEAAGLLLPGYAMPKVHAGLPYGAEGLLEGFQDKEKIVHSWLENSLWYQFRDFAPKEKASIVLFTWVMSGGLGDFSAQIRIARRLRKAFPEVDISLITLLAKSETRAIPPGDFETTLLHYDHQEEVAIPTAVMEKLGKASIILQLPTFYPYWGNIESALKNRGLTSRILHLGEYGFINSTWYHPKSGNMCMGVHPLEKGILFEEKVEGQRAPNTYFAYFITERGAAIYLHALLASKKSETSDLTLRLSHPLPVLQAIEKESLLGYGIASVILLEGSKKAEHKIGEEGKKLFLIPLHGLLPKDVQREMAESENFVGCRGDQSFSEVASQGKFFFYDALDHALPFLIDLYDLAKHYLPYYFSLHDYLKTLFDRETPPRELGMHIADLMLDPALVKGMEKLLEILRRDFSFEDPLIHMLQMHLCYKENPLLEERNLAYFTKWLKKELPVKDLLYFFAKR